jgi:hypothetical protein
MKVNYLNYLALLAIFILQFLAAMAFFTDVMATVKSFIHRQTSLAPEPQFLKVKMDLPLVPQLRVYLFNVTNADDFLSGVDDSSNVQEVGPFTYAARQEKDMLENLNNRMRFRSRTTYTFLPKESLSSDVDTVMMCPTSCWCPACSSQK